jgi:hypothetical protein
MFSGFKTVAFGVLIALIAVFSSAEMQVFFAENLPMVGGFVGTAIVILRAITNSSIFKPPAE